MVGYSRKAATTENPKKSLNEGHKEVKERWGFAAGEEGLKGARRALRRSSDAVKRGQRRRAGGKKGCFMLWGRQREFGVGGSQKTEANPSIRRPVKDSKS